MPEFSKKTTTLANGKTVCYCYKKLKDGRKVRISLEDYNKHKKKGGADSEEAEIFAMCDRKVNDKIRTQYVNGNAPTAIVASENKKCYDEEYNRRQQQSSKIFEFCDNEVKTANPGKYKTCYDTLHDMITNKEIVPTVVGGKGRSKNKKK